MMQVQQITDNTWQNQTLVLPDGSQIYLELYYRPMQYGWYVNSLTYGDFVVNGLRLTVGADMLYPFKNLIPFGLVCTTNLRREPTQQQDFSSGAFSLFVLTSDEIDQYTTFLSSAS